MKRLLIANRGEIALRIARSARELGYEVCAITTVADRDSIVRKYVPKIIEVSSFLAINEIVSAAKQCEATHIHPGYGFLSESASFADAVEAAGLVFVGPTGAQMRRLGSKEGLKELAMSLGLPVLASISSSEILSLSIGDLLKLIERRGMQFPLLVKASAGGGGRGMRLVRDSSELEPMLELARNEASASFGDSGVFLEQYLSNPKHIEIQIFGDGKGGGVALGERECSVQRRHQKMIEESPSPFVDQGLRHALGDVALKLVHSTSYRGAGTVEFLVGSDRKYYLLEVNTRLQVEHAVTEVTTGIDIVCAQLELAEGSWPTRLPLAEGRSTLDPNGVGIELRIVAEDPNFGFAPSPGRISAYREPNGVGIRVDSGVELGSTISTNFDSLIAKIIVHADTRELAIKLAERSLGRMIVHGVNTNIQLLSSILRASDFIEGKVHVNWLEGSLLELLEEDALKGWINVINNRLIRRSFVEATTKRGDGDKDDSFFKLLTGKRWSGVPSSLAYFASKARADHQNIVDIDLVDRGSQDKIAVAVSSNCGNIYISSLGATKLLTDPANEKFVASSDLSGSDKCEICAPLPGRIVQITVKRGAIVASGEVLMILESMKMQIQISAPIKGILKALEVSVGNTVNSGTLLAIIAN